MLWVEKLLAARLNANLGMYLASLTELIKQFVTIFFGGIYACQEELTRVNIARLGDQIRITFKLKNMEIDRGNEIKNNQTILVSIQPGLSRLSIGCFKHQKKLWDYSEKSGIEMCKGMPPKNRKR